MERAPATVGGITACGSGDKVRTVATWAMPDTPSWGISACSRLGP